MRRKYFQLSIVLLAICACTKTPENVPEQLVEISMRSVQDGDTKTTLEPGNKVHWSSTDRLSVLDGAGNREFSTEGSGASAMFTGEVLESATLLYAVYPYNPSASLAGGMIRTSVPENQTAQLDGFAPGMNLIASKATVASGTFEFKQVCALVKVNLQEEDVTAITFRGNKGEALSGVADISFDSSGIPSATPVSAGTSVTLSNGGSPLSLGNYYLSVLPGTLAKGFTLSFSYKNGGTMVASTDKSATLKRGTILNLGAIDRTDKTMDLGGECPFKKGVALDDWFGLGDSYVSTATYTAQDFANIKSLGFDAVRLPLPITHFIGGGSSYTLSSKFFTVLDYAMDLAEANDLFLILDVHSWTGTPEFTASDVTILTKVWQQIAAHCAGRSHRIVYELLNEPRGSYLLANWYTVQTNLIGVVRALDPYHSIMVCGTVDSIDELANIPSYEDPNLIYNFHFYTPHLFTHQGADWDYDGMDRIDGEVPFPYNPSTMPSCPDGAAAGLVEYFSNYPTQGTLSYLTGRIDAVESFATSRGVPVCCGEFGALNTISNANRCNWYKRVCDAFEAAGISWISWQYRNPSNTLLSFGLYNGANVFDQNLNTELLTAMGLTVPAVYSRPFGPDILLYDDAIANYAYNNSYNGEAPADVNTGLDLVCTDSPAQGSNHIRWTPKVNYASISFTFWPVTSFASQRSGDYHLEFYIRTSDPVDKLTVRFVQFLDEHPLWRNNVEIGNTAGTRTFASDGQWHLISIPLSAFWIKGTNGGWYDYTDYKAEHPEEEFAWGYVNHFQFATEGNSSLKEKEIDIDHVIIRGGASTEELSSKNYAF